MDNRQSIKAMKYQLTKAEETAINAGKIITIACYTEQDKKTAKFICGHLNIKHKTEKSESPTGRKIEIYFTEPETLYTAYLLGQMLVKPELYKEEIEATEIDENV